MTDPYTNFDNIMILIKDLYDENADLRDRLRQMHRRAQASEGAILRYEGLLESTNRLIDSIRCNCDWKYKHWKQLYEDAVKLITDAGVDDTINGDPMHRTGHLDVLIRRLIDQIDTSKKNNS